MSTLGATQTPPVHYPLPEYSDFARRVDREPSGLRTHEWIGNDRVQRNHHGVVRREDHMCVVRLSWKETDSAIPYEVGLFVLNLDALLEGGYVRSDGQDIRLRFVRKEDGLVYIQSRSGGPALAVGESGIAC